MFFRTVLFTTALAGFAMTAGVASGNELATATGVDQAAFLRATSALRPVIEGNRLSDGDVVETQGTGQVQILFDDFTRIVVGPNSRLEIDEILMQNNKTASRFAVSTVRGSFRFITGKSAKSAYEITTPTATLGVRGTVFDTFVDSFGTTIAGIWGNGFACNRAGECQPFGNRCDVLTIDQDGNFSKPATVEEAGQALENLPYVQSQAPLYQPYRTNINSCARYTGFFERNSVPEDSSNPPDNSPRRSRKN